MAQLSRSESLTLKKMYFHKIGCKTRIGENKSFYRMLSGLFLSFIQNLDLRIIIKR